MGKKLYAQFFGNWRTTLIGLIGGVVAGVSSYLSSGNHITLTGIGLTAVLALLGVLFKDAKDAHLGMIDNLVLKYGEGAVTEALQKAIKEQALKTVVTVLAVLLLLPCLMHAQAVPEAPLPQNVYAGGISYNNGASPSIAGTALYARLLSDGSGTYAFTVVDALPVSVKPFTVNTNIGLGVAQKVVTIGKATVFVPTSAGISFNGTNTGWAWSTGALVSVPVKNNWRVFPNVRIVKSSVGGDGYHPIAGVMVGWGQ